MLITSAVPVPSVFASNPLTLDQAIGQIGAERLRSLLQMPIGGMWGNGAMWGGRIDAIMSFGVELAYGRGFPGIQEILDYTTFEAYVDASVSYELSPQMLKRVRSALRSLPGFEAERGYGQTAATLSQFWYIQSNYHDALNLLRIGGDGIASDVLSGNVNWEVLNHRHLASQRS